MRRPKTIAGKDFRKNIEVLLQYLKYFTANRSTLKPIATILLGGIISKVYAEFENYITDSIAENLGQLSKRMVLLSQLPKEIRSTLIFTHLNHDHFKNYYASSDEFRLLSNIETQYIKRGFSWEGSVSYQISHFDILRKQTYPSRENLEIVFRRLGIDNVFFELNKMLKRDSMAIIGSANSIRCGFVHESQDPTLTIGDLKKIIKDLLLFVMALDTLVYKYINSIK